MSKTPAGTIQHVKPVSPTKNTVVRVPQVLLASTVKTVGDLKNSLEVFLIELWGFIQRNFRLLFIRYRTNLVPRVFSLFVYRGKERTLVMRSSHTALTDSRSSVSRVVQRNLVSVTSPFFLLFFSG